MEDNDLPPRLHRFNLLDEHGVYYCSQPGCGITVEEYQRLPDTESRVCRDRTCERGEPVLT